ncbi:calcium-binding protein [Nocardioides caldifontis]|uniref:calcium-binding protein n=1 Tax=Nocardioides caldifontis TaxID=2588938 RepID=UPI001396B377|nr:calcium-binding protein [Nocardioides caldifontis]
MEIGIGSSATSRWGRRGGTGRLGAGGAIGALVLGAAMLAPEGGATATVASSGGLPRTSTSEAAKPKCMGKRATVIGDGRDNVLRGTNRSDVIVAGGGDDTIYGKGGNDLVCAGGGSDTVVAGAGHDRVRAGAGSDIVIGAAGNDILAGQGGPDGMIGDAGADRINGGGGVDLLAYLGTRKGVRVDMAKGRASGGAGKDRFSGFEGLVDTPRADTLLGSKRNEAFFPSGGADRIDGRGGRDYLIHTLSPRGVTVDLSKGTATGRVKLSSIENVFGSPHRDTITGTRGFNELDGQAGQDTIRGNGGGDMCFAEQVTGCDRLTFAGTPPTPTQPPPGQRTRVGALGAAMLRYQGSPDRPGEMTTRRAGGQAVQYGRVECPAMSRAAWATSFVRGVGFIQAEQADGNVWNSIWMYYNGLSTWLWDAVSGRWIGPVVGEQPTVDGIFVGERGRARAWWWSSEWGQWYPLGACIGNGVPLGFNFS